MCIRDSGTAIHAAIEQAYKEGWFSTSPHSAQVNAASDAVIFLTRESVNMLRAETTFAHPDGYGGTVDLHLPGEWIIDFKTKDGSVADAKTYPEHWMQLAAYRRGLGYKGARCAIVYVSRDLPEAFPVELTEDQLAQGEGMFLGLLRYWQEKNQYIPEWRAE